MLKRSTITCFARNFRESVAKSVYKSVCCKRHFNYFMAKSIQDREIVLYSTKIWINYSDNSYSRRWKDCDAKNANNKIIYIKRTSMWTKTTTLLSNTETASCLGLLWLGVSLPLILFRPHFLCLCCAFMHSGNGQMLCNVIACVVFVHCENRCLNLRQMKYLMYECVLLYTFFEYLLKNDLHRELSNICFIWY